MARSQSQSQAQAQSTRSSSLPYMRGRNPKKTRKQAHGMPRGVDDASSADANSMSKASSSPPPPPPSSVRLIVAALLGGIFIVPIGSAIVRIALLPSSSSLSSLYSPPPLDYGTGSMFDSIAERYDFINRALALGLDTGWRRRMVKEVTDDGDLFRRPRDGQQQQRQRRSSGNDEGAVRMLDLATGTADVAILLGEAAAAAANSGAVKATVLGIDPSASMIDVGRRKIHTHKSASASSSGSSSIALSDIVTLQMGDARNLHSLNESYFDVLTMAFGIRNVPERDVALCQMYRVLRKPPQTTQPWTRNGKTRDDTSEASNAATTKETTLEKSENDKDSKGGRLAILEFSEPPPNSGFLPSLARLFIRHVVPILGAALSGAPTEYMHLQNSIKNFPSPNDFVALMEGLECPVYLEHHDHHDNDDNGDANDNVAANEESKTKKKDTSNESTTDLRGAFVVDKVINMNFGSVQLYLATPVVKRKYIEQEGNGKREAE